MIKGFIQTDGFGAWQGRFLAAGENGQANAPKKVKPMGGGLLNWANFGGTQTLEGSPGYYPTRVGPREFRER